MPKHDLPDGRESDNLIAFREHLRRRIDQSAQDNDPSEPERSIQEIYRRAEHGDGKPPKLGWQDGLWLGLFLAIGWMLWIFVRH